MSAEQYEDNQTNLSSMEDYLTVKIADQLFGIPVLHVQDVLSIDKMTKIPLAPPEILGSMNLRGRIVTAINVRKRLGMDVKLDDSKEMSVVIEHEDELYSLVIDSVGDVIRLNKNDYEAVPATLDETWREIALGIYRIDDKLLVVIDVPKLLSSIRT